ncbi:MAG: hypothetical protein QM484_04585 [Woeseiaceae bacterium]
MKQLLFKLSIYSVLAAISMSCSADKGISADFADGVKLILTTNPFDAKAHKVETCGKRNIPCYVDGKIIYGGRGKLPTDEVVSLVFEKDGKQQRLDISSIYNPGVTKSNIAKRFNIQKYLSKNTYRVIGYFGPEKRPYIAHWLVREDGSIRNHLSDFESLNSLMFEVKKDLGIKY